MDNDIVIEENGPLHSYLRDLGYNEMETLKQRSPTADYKCIKTQKEAIGSDVLNQVLTLRATNLLFEDDLSNVDTILENFESTKNESLKFILKSKSCSLALLAGLFLYFYIGIYAFIFLSSFYAYRAADYLWKKHVRLKLIKRLMSSIQGNYSLLTKVIKFLHENEQLFKLSSKVGANADVINNLKRDFSLILTEVNKVFVEGTKRLLTTAPLCDYMENPGGYFCNKVSAYEIDNNISKLHNLYMLLQSQFLARLIFSTVPNLLVNDQDSYIAVGKVVVFVSTRLQGIQTLVNKKFKLVLLNGLYVNKSSSARPLPPKPPKHSNEFFCQGIHDLSNSLQFCLIHLRNLEENMELQHSVPIEDSLDLVKNEMSSCQSLISDLEILYKKYSKENLDCLLEEEKVVVSKDEGDAPATELGFSDLDPVVDDDIFEMTVGDLSDSTEDLCDDPSFDSDPLSRKRQRQMLVELKGRLKEQAEDWAKREALVLVRKNMAPLESVQSDILNNNSDVENESEEECNGLRRRYCNKYNRIFETECTEGANDDVILPGLSSYDGIDGVLFGGGASLFAEAMKQASVSRGIVAEEFGDSSENSGSESK